MAMMMNELDFSRDRTGDMSSEQEEIQIFNNRLFSPSRRPDNSMTQPAPFDDQSPIRASRGLGSAGRDDTDNSKWLDPEQLHKDTLDLNYQAELNNSQRNRMANLSNQSSRLEDLLREADLAVKKSQGLTTKVQNENYQSSYTPSYQSDYGRFSSIPYSSSGQDRFSSTPNYFNNQLPQQQNYYPSNPSYVENQSLSLNRPSQAPLSSYTDPAWITVKQQQPQGSWTTESSLSDPRLSTKASKSGRTYDLFPIQEAAETGAETPRVIKKSPVNYSQSPNQNYGAYNFGGPSSLADKVLNMNPDSRGPAAYSSAERPKQTSYQNAENNSYSKPVPTWGSSNPEFGLQPKTLGGDIRHSMGPIEEDSRENLPTFHGPGHDSMDKKVDEIIQRHISGNTFEDNQGVPSNNLRNSNLRNSNLRNSNIQQDLDPYNETPQGFAPTSGFSGEPARPFSAYDVSPGPNRLSQSTTFPNQGIERGSVPLKEVPTNNMFLSEARRTKSEVNFEQQPLYLTSPKPSGSQYEEGVYPTWSTSKTENRFTSPLLQKYSNPFLNEHLMTLTSPKVVVHGDHEDMRHSPQEMYHHHGEEKVKSHGHHVNASGSVMGVTDPLFQKEDLRNIDIIKRVRRDNTIILKKPQKPVVQTFRAGELEDDVEPQLSYRAGELIDDHESPKVRHFPTEFHGAYNAGDLEDDHDSFIMGSKKKSSPNRPGVRSYDPASMTSEENFDAEMYFQNQYDMAPAQEISPDKKMKKLTFKNRPSEEKSAERRGFDPISEREDLTLSQEPTIGKQRRKIFESKLPDPEPRHSHQLLSASMGRDSEKSRRLIFSDIKEKHIKDIDHVADPWEENIHTNEADEGNPSENVKKAHASPGAKLGDLNREKPSTLNDLGYPRPNEDDDYGYFDENDKLPYQLHNGAMDISQSFFDFENEKAFGQDEFAGGPRGTTSQRGRKVNAAAPPQNPAASNRSQAQKKPVGKIWVLDTSQQSQAGRGLTNSQTLNQSLKKVPLLTHCFEKFEGINDGFPKV